MPNGFGNEPFGTGPFGGTPWASKVLYDLIPDTYKDQDVDAGGQLQAFIEGIVPSMDYLRDKVAGLSDLRDPLLVPTDQTFLRAVEILQTDDLGDGTSRVFISQGEDGTKLDNIRYGYILSDSAGNRFEIIGINTSGRASDFTSVPIDPWTGNPTGKNVIVNNISLDGLEVIPRVSGALISQENPTPTPVDDGTNTGLFVFTVANPPVAKNIITVNWTESGVAKTGYFLSTGKYFGDLSVGSTVDLSKGKITAGIDGVPDNDSIRVTYTTTLAYEENPTTVPLDDGVDTGPYVFTVKYPPIADVTLIQLSQTQTFTKDATKGWAFPATSSEWSTFLTAARLTTAGPGFLWGDQDNGSIGDTSLSDAIGGTPMKPNAPPGFAPGYGTTVAGFSRKAVTFSDNINNESFVISSGGPDLGSNSVAWLVCCDITTTPSTLRTLLIADGTGAGIGVRVTATGHLQLDCVGVSTVSTNVYVGIGPFWMMLLYNRTARKINLVTASEVITGVYAASGGGGNKGIGAVPAT